jgi:hypothetical protein
VQAAKNAGTTGVWSQNPVAAGSKILLAGCVASIDTCDVPAASRTSAAGQRVLARLRTIGPFLEGSLSITTKRCGKPTCRCVEAGPIHDAAVLTWKEAGTTRTLHVPIALREEVAAWVAEGKRLKALSHEMAVAQRAFFVAQRRPRGR